MNRKLLFLILISVSFTCQIAKAQDSLLNYKNSSRYAAYLFENKLYDLSAIEYERVVFLEPNDSLAKMRLIQSYRLMNDLKTAKAKLDGFVADFNNCLNSDFAAENVRILFDDKRYHDCDQFIATNRTLDPDVSMQFKTASLLMQYRWAEAKETSKNYLLKSQDDLRLSKLYEISEIGSSINYKNPYAAAVFSGIIPGSGKFYTKQWKDGLYAFLAVTAFSYLTYRSFDKDGLNPYGFIFGTVSFAFYTSNIFGSYKSAIRYNRKRNENTVKDVKMILEE